jgi:hypothetical protein
MGSQTRWSAGVQDDALAEGIEVDVEDPHQPHVERVATGAAEQVAQAAVLLGDRIEAVDARGGDVELALAALVLGLQGAAQRQLLAGRAEQPHLRRRHPPQGFAHHRGALLAEIIEVYWLARRAPVCFFPEAALRYVEALRSAARDSSKAPIALDVAREAYLPLEHSRERGDGTDPYVAMLFAVCVGALGVRALRRRRRV